MADQKTTTQENTAERIAGAKAGIAALAALEQDTQGYPGDDYGIWTKSHADSAAALVAQFGPLTPRQEGAFRALVEYVAYGMTTGERNLEQWRPAVGMTAEELELYIDGAREVAMYGPGGSMAANAPSPKQSPEEPSTPDHTLLKAALGLILECALSADAIYRLADRMIEESAMDRELTGMATLIKDSADRIEKRLEIATEQMEGRG